MADKLCIKCGSKATDKSLWRYKSSAEKFLGILPSVPYCAECAIKDKQ